MSASFEAVTSDAADICTDTGSTLEGWVGAPCSRENINEVRRAIGELQRQLAEMDGRLVDMAAALPEDEA